MPEVPSISAEQFAQQCQQGEVKIVDVRTPLEYRELHAIGSRNCPLDRLDPGELIQELQPSEKQPIYLICRSGGRATKACERFVSAGHGDVVVVEGGILACAQAGVPVQRGKKAMSLERQTRIAAGGLVAIGGLLSFFVSPWFFLIPTGVGCGLVFAGITDSCAMGMLLAKMPWNQVAGSDTNSSSDNSAASCSM